MKEILKYIWQLPQNLCGLVYKAYLNKTKGITKHTNIDSVELYKKKTKGGVSLGKYIFIYYRYRDITKVTLHEIGHTKQSLILGPLYLIVIGLPSIIWAFLHSYTTLFSKYNYYSFYTEKWANKLVGLK